MHTGERQVCCIAVYVSAGIDLRPWKAARCDERTCSRWVRCCSAFRRLRCAVQTGREHTLAAERRRSNMAHQYAPSWLCGRGTLPLGRCWHLSITLGVMGHFADERLFIS
jgi:hypothetical protein